MLKLWKVPIRRRRVLEKKEKHSMHSLQVKCVKNTYIDQREREQTLFGFRCLLRFASVLSLPSEMVGCLLAKLFVGFTVNCLGVVFCRMCVMCSYI